MFSKVEESSFPQNFMRNNYPIDFTTGWVLAFSLTDPEYEFCHLRKLDHFLESK